MRLSPQQQHLHFDSSGRSPDLPLGKYQAGVLSSSPSVRDEEDSFGHSTTRSEEVTAYCTVLIGDGIPSVCVVVVIYK